MKIAYYTDPHITDTQSRSWIGGDNLAFCLANLNYIYTNAVAKGCDSILCSGDFFHERNQKQFVVREVIQELKKHNIVTIVVPGQHDTSNHSSADYNLHSLGVVEAALGDQFKVIHSGQHEIRAGYVVYGFGFSDPETTQLLDGDVTFPLEDYPNLPHIAIVHASVGPNGWGGQEPKDVTATGFDWVLLGDIHPGFEPYQSDDGGPVVFGVGSTCKRSLNEAGLTPKYAVIDLTTYDLEVFPIPVPDESALLKRGEATISEEVNTKVAEFVSMFSSISSMEGMTPNQIVTEIAQSNCIDDAVRDSFLRRL